MSWHILGAGSMGCLWASLLRERGEQVKLLLKDATVAEQYRVARGISLERDGALHHVACEAAVVADSGKWTHGDAGRSLIVSTKAYDTLTALRAVRAALPHYRAIVLIQNGMGTTTEIEREFPGLPLYVGITAHGVWRRSRFHVVHAGEGPTWIGPAVVRTPALPREPVTPLLEIASPVHWDEEMLPRMWTKVAINSVINGLTVLLRCRNGDILKDTQRPRMERLCKEADQVLATVLEPTHGRGLLDDVVEIATATAGNFSSMLQDVQQGRRTEVDYINGYLCRAADERGIEIPEHKRLLRELRDATG